MSEMDCMSLKSNHAANGVSSSIMITHNGLSNTSCHPYMTFAFTSSFKRKSISFHGKVVFKSFPYQTSETVVRAPTDYNFLQLYISTSNSLFEERSGHYAHSTQGLVLIIFQLTARS